METATSLRAGVDTAVGPVWVEAQGGAVVRAGWGAVGDPGESALLRAAAAELRAYFDGQLTAFTVPVRHGRDGATGAVLDALAAIPFGETRTYGDLARDLGIPAQAVEQACGANPIPILIPCHRVLSSTGLGGFSAPGGVETKVRLLRHEKAAGLLI